MQLQEAVQELPLLHQRPREKDRVYQ